MNVVIAVLSWIDVAVLAVIIWCAIDGSRMIVAKENPWRATAYYVTAVGTLGYLLHRQFFTVQEAGWTLLMHVGMLMYAVIHIIKRTREVNHVGNRAAGHRWGFHQNPH